MTDTATPTPEQVLRVMEEGRPFMSLENDAWRAYDVALRLGGYRWPEVEPVLEELERQGKVIKVKLRGMRTPRYRLLGG